jgi:hypothetical protein
VHGKQRQKDVRCGVGLPFRRFCLPITVMM